jgi:hypothetical protein
MLHIQWFRARKLPNRCKSNGSRPVAHHMWICYIYNGFVIGSRQEAAKPLELSWFWKLWCTMCRKLPNHCKSNDSRPLDHHMLHIQWFCDRKRPNHCKFNAFRSLNHNMLHIQWFGGRTRPNPCKSNGFRPIVHHMLHMQWFRGCKRPNHCKSNGSGPVAPWVTRCYIYNGFVFGNMW